MPPSEWLTTIFTGALCIATVVYVVLTWRLWKVSMAQSKIQSDLRTIQLVTSKHEHDPDLRAHHTWECKTQLPIGNDGPGTEETREVFEVWEGALHLWNTGSSALLITGWELDAGKGSNRPRMCELRTAVQVKPPIVVSPHSLTQIRADVSGRQCRRLLIRYNTPTMTGRALPIPLRTPLGYQNVQEDEPHDE